MEDIRYKDKLMLSKAATIVVEDGKCILRKIKPQEEDLFVLTRIQGVILCMLEGKREFFDICEDLSYITDTSFEKVESIVRDFINMFRVLIQINSGEEREDLDLMEVAKNTKISESKKITKIMSKELIREPVSLVYFLTDNCSSDCIYCAVGASFHKNNYCNKNMLTLEEVKDLAKQTSEMNFKEVELTGGDPLTHPQILEVIKSFNNENINVNLSTKIPFDNKFIDSIKNLKHLNLQISLDALEYDLYEKMTGVNKERLDKVINCLKLLSEYKLKYKIKTTITSYNIEHIPDMIQDLYAMGCRNVHVQAYYRSQEKHEEKLFPTKEQYKKLNEKLEKMQSRYKDMELILGYSMELINGSREYRSLSRAYCLGGRKSITIYPNGDFSMCGMTRNSSMCLGNIRGLGLKKAWESKEIKDMISPDKRVFQGTKCYDCSSFEECSERRCYLRSLIYFNTPYEMDPLCKYSNIDYKYTCD